MTEIVEVVERTVDIITQLGIDMGIPFDEIPKTAGEIANLQGHLQWAIFLLTATFGAFNNLVKSVMGVIR